MELFIYKNIHFLNVIEISLSLVGNTTENYSDMVHILQIIQFTILPINNKDIIQ